ncbi:hypothetical protein DL96DRAFT_1587747 [Flagelloscypha sp. PMI_526]|nr:hypothetical protein DL96DRAFT_1587747 [Flagelloscypha sp. PMI_526]
MKRPRKQQLFSSCQTNTPCVIFISCKKPVDPVRLVLTHLYAVKASGITKTRHALRLTPISVSCSAAMESIQQMCKKLFTQYFERQPDQTYTFKIELKMRNHTTLSRPDLLKTIAECVPPPHKVNLDSPQVFILVEVFKALCGVSVVQDYDTLRKFNVQELATASRTEGVSVEDIVSRV